MQGAVNYVKGSVRIRVKCKYPERIINICARNGVDFRELQREENGDTLMTVSISGYRTLRKIAKEGGLISISPLRRSGVPFFLWRIRKRYVLLAGMALCLVAVWVSSFFIWQIDVEGNETVSTSEILACLKKLGVEIGASTFSVSRSQLSNEMLLMIPELSWITLNTHGSRIEVIVREEIKKPEIYDPDTPMLVYAEKAGIITEMTVSEGNPLVSAGDTVDAGDELVSGVMVGGKSGVRLMRASAEVWARTWYEFSLKMPLETAVKEYTGEKTTRTALIIGGKRVNLYFSGGNPYGYYDKMTVYKTAELPGGAVLPLTVITETYEEYRPVYKSLSFESAESVLKSRLLAMLEEEIADGYVVSTDYASTEENGVVTVTLYAECVEQIAASRELTEEEISLAESSAGEITDSE
ncbi:MAG: sporulation protein YqfD [Oscillospiraceae bacterium]